jgi:epoxyqueuosine reductase
VGLDLDEDAPFTADHCGTCRRCIDACPTGAILEPHVVDARQCVSYLTIELKGEIPDALKPGIGDRVYGCDICQDVCPWNEKFSLPLREEALRPGAAIAGKNARALARELLEMSQDDFSKAFKSSPMKRAKLRGLKRNAGVVLGNLPDSA